MLSPGPVHRFWKKRKERRQYQEEETGKCFSPPEGKLIKEDIKDSRGKKILGECCHPKVTGRQSEQLHQGCNGFENWPSNLAIWKTWKFLKILPPSQSAMV